MMKRYIEYGNPGILFADLNIRELSDEEYRDILNVECVKKSSIFRFFDREVYTSVTGDIIIGEKKNYSGWYYKNGQIKTLEDICNEMPGSILLDNMLSNNWDRVVNICGKYYPLLKEDIVIK